jgi:Flp pilus assembly protein TadB
LFLFLSAYHHAGFTIKNSALKQIGRIATLVIGVCVIVFTVVASLAGTLAHPWGAAVYVIFVFWLLLFFVLVRNLQARIRQKRAAKS